MKKASEVKKGDKLQLYNPAEVIPVTDVWEDKGFVYLLLEGSKEAAMCSPDDEVNIKEEAS